MLRMSANPDLREWMFFPALWAELARIDELLASHLARLRRRGRSDLVEQLHGALVEEGEVDGVLAELRDLHRRAVAPPLEAPPASALLPGLEQAVCAYGLDSFERDVLMLTLAVEIDSRYGRLCAFLNDHAQRTRPTVGLLATLLRGADCDPRTLMTSFLATGRLVRWRLIEVEGDGPLAGRNVKAHEQSWPRLLDLASAPSIGRLADEDRAP